MYSFRLSTVIILIFFSAIACRQNDNLQTSRQSHEIIYTGDSLANIGVPVGGIGTGDVLIGGRGNIRSLEVFNHSDMAGNPPYMTFFSVWCKPVHGKPVSKILEGKMPDESPGPYGITRNQLSGLPRFADVAFSARYPFVELQLKDPDIPLNISGEFFNPLIPLDVDNSSLPVAAFYWKVENPTRDTIDASVDFNLANLLQQKDRNGRLTRLGDRNEYFASGNARGVIMSNTGKEGSPLFGNILMATTHPEGEVQTSWYEGAWWDDATIFWEDFSADGKLKSRHEAVTWEGSDWYGYGNQSIVGSVNARVRLAPGETRTIPFYITWYIPDRILEAQMAFGNTEVQGAQVKNYYATKFNSAQDALGYYLENEQRLVSLSRDFTNRLFNSSLPDYVIDAINANTAILKTNLLMRSSQGWLHGFEGLGDEEGCCAGNCNHVWNYAQTMAALFPSLERSVRETSFNHNTFPNGYQCFRTVFPLGDYWFKNVAADAQMGNIVRAYREWKYSGDDAWLKNIWPNIKLALEYAWKGPGKVTGEYRWQSDVMVPWDPEKEGVMRGDQHNTYDIDFFGPNMMTGSVYLAALKACSEMAGYLGEEDKQQEYGNLYHKGLERYNDLLWNGEYFVQKVEVYPGIKIPPHLESPPDNNGNVIPKYQLGNGCLSDQLVGQFMAFNAGLGFILDKETVKKSMHSVYKNNFVKDLSEFQNVQRVFAKNHESGLVIATWPEGDRPKLPFVYSDEVWTGIEYGAAVNMIRSGLVDEGLEVVKAVRDRYRGYNRNPWGEIESGMFYARAMASWSLLDALSGFDYDGVHHSITIDPALHGNSFNSLWTSGTGWGFFRLSGNELVLEVDFGNLEISDLILPVKKVRETLLNNSVINANLEEGKIIFKERLIIQKGDSLIVKLF